MFYRLIDLTTRHRAETEMETDRLRQAQMQAERLLEARERANRQKVKGMEETVSTCNNIYKPVPLCLVSYSNNFCKRQTFNVYGRF